MKNKEVQNMRVWLWDYFGDYPGYDYPDSACKTDEMIRNDIKEKLLFWAKKFRVVANDFKAAGECEYAAEFRKFVRELINMACAGVRSPLPGGMYCFSEE